MLRRVMDLNLRRWLGAAAAALTLGLAPTSASPPAAAPGVHAGAAILMDAATGQVLLSDHAYRQMDPASTTKMMTAYLVIRAGGLQRTVSVSRRAALTPGSRMRLHTTDRYSLMDLLRGLLLPSGNDAAVALAEAESGSVPAFVEEMNRTARALGAYQTHFVNPNGLTARGHYSSAYDLAVIARAALALPVFQHLVSTPADRVTELRRGQSRLLHNSNRLLEAFPLVDGVKTGTTSAAGPCLVASATAGGTQLIAVVLNAPHRWQAAARLLHWGFRHWHRHTWLEAGRAVLRLPVAGGAAAWVPLVPRRTLATLVPDGPRTLAEVRTSGVGSVAAPVRRGQPLGRATVVVEGTLAGARTLVAGRAVARRRRPPRRLPFWPWVTGGRR